MASSPLTFHLKCRFRFSRDFTTFCFTENDSLVKIIKFYIVSSLCLLIGQFRCMRPDI